MTTLPRTPADAPYVALFTIDVVPERREDFLAAMEKAMAESSKEPGVASFMLLSDRDDPNRFTAVDTYFFWTFIRATRFELKFMDLNKFKNCHAHLARMKERQSVKKLLEFEKATQERFAKAA